MLKKCLIVLVCAVCLALGVCAAEPAYDAYTLCYNTFFRKDFREEWIWDNRASDVANVLQTDHNYIEDIDAKRSSAFYRDLNLVDQGIVTLEASLGFSAGFDGFTMKFTDLNGNETYALETDNGAFYVKQANGAREYVMTRSTTSYYYHCRVILNFETGYATTIINDVNYGETPLLSTNIYRFGFYTSKEDLLTVVPFAVKLTANYTMYDDFLFYPSSTGLVPYDYTSSSTANAYIASRCAYVKNGASLTKNFTAIGNTAAFEGTFYLEPNAAGTITLYSGQNTALTLSLDKNAFKANSQVQYTPLLESFWNRYRVEMDFDTHTALVKINGRKAGEVALPSSISSVDKVSFTATGKGMRLDDIKLFSLIDHDDYVPMPVIPSDSQNNIVGINVCSLWSYDGFGWANVSPFDEFRPVLGYYDEGSPETADWEIKFLTEHGVDFQAFCWYADQSNAPLQAPPHADHLHNGFMNARYADMTKYCLIWEAKNGAHPQDSNAFRNYFVPYWIENYFKDERYMVIDNRPILFVFGINHFIDDMGSEAACKAELDYLREQVKALGFTDIIILASNATDSDQIVNAGLDGVCAYNWWKQGYDLDYSIRNITACADIGKTYTVPTLSVGFNNLPWDDERFPNMTLEDYKTGLTWIRDTYFNTYPKDANKKQTWQDRFMILSTWNEYGEGTYIMPAEGLHGFGYLDIIREVFTDGDVPHADVVPSDDQLVRINRDYPQHLHLLRRFDNTEFDPEITLAPLEQTVDFSEKTSYYVANTSSALFTRGTLVGVSASSVAYDKAYVETRGSHDIPLGGATAMRITMSVSKDTKVEVYYTTSDNPMYSQEMYASFTATAGGEKSYTFFADKLSGNLEKLRIYPADTSGVMFSLVSVEFLTKAQLFVDDTLMTSKVYPEIHDGTLYFPFDPSTAEPIYLNIHHEWDYATKTLSIYGDDDRYIRYTVGSDVAQTHQGNVTLPMAVFMSDGLPMLDMVTFCQALGMDYRKKGADFYVESRKYDTNSYLSNRPPYDWNFTYGMNLGWGTNAQWNLSGGKYHMEAIQDDTIMQNGNLSLNAIDYTHVEIKLSYTIPTEGTRLQVFFITDKDRTWSESKSMTLITPTDIEGNDHIFRFPITENNLWKDTIVGLRIDPLHITGQICDIEYIKLIPVPKDPVEGEGGEDEGEEEERPAYLESLALDAEDGNVPFYSGSAQITIIADPSDSTGQNHIFRVKPINGVWIDSLIDVFFEPGATYKISYDLSTGSAGGNTTVQTATRIHGDVRYHDPKQIYEALNNNIYDHVLTGATPLTNILTGPLDVTPSTPEEERAKRWTHMEFTHTVPMYAFVRNIDQFRLYANPVTNNALGIYEEPLEFYFDNLVITRVYDKSATVDTAQIQSGILTVTGSLGSTIPHGAIALVAAYDTNDRLLGTSIAENTNGTYTATMSVSEAYRVKVFFFEDWKKLNPCAASLEKMVS